jgi:hypothetical protein
MASRAADTFRWFRVAGLASWLPQRLLYLSLT